MKPEKSPPIGHLSRTKNKNKIPDKCPNISKNKQERQEFF